MVEIVNRKVLDLSHHNNITSWDAIKRAGVVGIIHKATEGSTYVDPTYKPRRGTALANNLIWGAYHFANSASVQSQVDNFSRTVGEDADTLYCLDWEDNDGNMMSTDNARRFIELLEDRIGEKRTVIYSGNTAKEQISGKDRFFGERRLWLAHYSSSPTCQASWDDFWLWQYSDGNSGPQPHGCPGVTGDVDTNSWAGTDEALRAQWSGSGAEPVPEGAVVSIDIAVKGDVQVLINGKPLQAISR